MSPLERVLKEAHRRGLWQVLVVFVGGGWGVLGALDMLIEYGYLPDWVFGGGLLALLLGLPVVSATAWVQGGRRVRPAATAGDPADEAVHRAFDAVDVFTWPRAITGGVLAFALLGVLAAGYMFMRATGLGAPGTLVAQGVLEEGARIVLADFESTAGEAASGDLLTESLRIDLAQSSALRLVPRPEIEAALERMRRDPAEPVTEDVALEIAEREGVPAVIAGEVGRVGSGFTINARVISSRTGEPLAAFRESAADESGLLDAIDRLARSMRDKIGESLRSIARTESLGSVTTSSIEALRKYTTASAGLDRGVISAAVAIQLYQEAVALDSTFSSAHRALAIAIFNYGGDFELMNRSSHAAFRHRDRLPERERLATEAFHHRFSGDRAAAARAYRAMLALDPGSFAAATNLADILMYDGEYEEAIEVARSAPGWESSAWTFNYLSSLAATGRTGEAEAVIDTFDVTVPDDPYHTWRRVMLHAVTGDPHGALEIAAQADPLTDPLADAYTRQATAVASATAGQVARASELYGGVAADLATYSSPANAMSAGLARPWMSLVVSEDASRALAELEALQRTVGWDGLSPLNRDYPGVALLHAMAGRTEEATRLMDRFEAEVTTAVDPATLGRAAVARAAVAVREGDPRGFEALDEALPAIDCARCADLIYGLLHESAGDAAGAAPRYERYLDHPFFDGATFFLHFFAPVVHERLGRLYDEQGDTERAAEHYAAFASLWAEADGDLQPRVERARRRAEELSRAR